MLHIVHLIRYRLPMTIEDTTDTQSSDTELAPTSLSEASEDETSIIDQELAWSIDPDAHTEEAPASAHHSWKIPLIVATLAVAAVAAVGAMTVWQHQSLPKAQPVTHAPSSPAPEPALAMTASDKIFLTSIKSYFHRDHPIRSEAQYDADTIATGRTICEILNMGVPVDQTVQMLYDKYQSQGPGQGQTMPQVRIVVDDAITAYCPKLY